jgi:hypothetical protein
MDTAKLTLLGLKMVDYSDIGPITEIYFLGIQSTIDIFQEKTHLFIVNLQNLLE